MLHRFPILAPKHRSTNTRQYRKGRPANGLNSSAHPPPVGALAGPERGGLTLGNQAVFEADGLEQAALAPGVGHAGGDDGVEGLGEEQREGRAVEGGGEHRAGPGEEADEVRGPRVRHDPHTGAGALPRRAAEAEDVEAQRGGPAPGEGPEAGGADELVDEEVGARGVRRRGDGTPWAIAAGNPARVIGRRELR